MKSDYTLVPVGTKIGGGEIKICPVCKKAGLAKQIEKVLVFIHLRWAGVTGDGFAEIRNEECQVPTTP
jgi:hypothetical protein